MLKFPLHGYSKKSNHFRYYSHASQFEVFFVSVAKRKSQKTREQQRDMMQNASYLCIAKRVTVHGVNSNHFPSVPGIFRRFYLYNSSKCIRISERLEHKSKLKDIRRIQSWHM